MLKEFTLTTPIPTTRILQLFYYACFRTCLSIPPSINSSYFCDPFQSKLQTSVHNLPNNSACDRPFSLSANMNLLDLQHLFYEKHRVLLMKFSGSFFHLMELRFLISCLGPAKHHNTSCNMKPLPWQTSLLGPHREWSRIG